jgi:hypothetical protein
MKTSEQKMNHDLLARLKAAAKTSLTPHERKQQCVSFVYSVMAGRESMTRENVERLVEQHVVA